MTDAEEFVLVPKRMYLMEQPKVKQILESKSIADKSSYLTLLQRNATKRNVEAGSQTSPLVMYATPNVEAGSQTSPLVMYATPNVEAGTQTVSDEKIKPFDDTDDEIITKDNIHDDSIEISETIPTKKVELQRLSQQEVIERAKKAAPTLTLSQLGKIGLIYDHLQNNPNIHLDKYFQIILAGRNTNIYLIPFLVDLQKTVKKIDPVYKDILQEIAIPEKYTCNTYAKNIIKNLLKTGTSIQHDESNREWEDFTD